MQYVTNGEFGILLIPECKQYSVDEIGIRNNFKKSHSYSSELDYIIPYRKPYDRIIRAIAADLHELMHDSGYVNLNLEKWDDVRSKSLDYIHNWLETATLPIVKDFCHTAYFTNYAQLSKNYVLIDVDNFEVLPKYIKQRYDIDVGEIKELPPEFYQHTVPYWEIDSLYHSHKKMHTLIDEWCASDQRLSATMVVDNLFINA